MKSFFFFILITTLFAALTLTSRADDAAHIYTGEITGVVCASCKAHVAAALTQKMPGIQNVDIERSDKPDTQKITITTTKGDVTKEAAVAALGELAASYQILSLEKKK
jgi:copper chaperone CopZ